MLVKELLLAEPVVCSIDDYLVKSAELIAENNLVCLPVVESPAHKNLIGVVTDKEICRKAIAAGLNPSKTTVGRVMNSSFLTIDPETELEECYRKMKDNQADFIFVTDENNSYLGVITEEDLSQRKVRFFDRQYNLQYIRNDRIF